MLEIKNTVTEVNIAFVGLISKLDTAEERTAVLETEEDVVTEQKHKEVSCC